MFPIASKAAPRRRAIVTIVTQGFFDTNVLAAAFATRGLCADLFAHVLLEHELVVCEVILDELSRPCCVSRVS